MGHERHQCSKHKLGMPYAFSGILMLDCPFDFGCCAGAHFASGWNQRWRTQEWILENERLQRAINAKHRKCMPHSNKQQIEHSSMLSPLNGNMGYYRCFMPSWEHVGLDLYYAVICKFLQAHSDWSLQCIFDDFRYLSIMANDATFRYESLCVGPNSLSTCQSITVRFFFDVRKSCYWRFVFYVC